MKKIDEQKRIGIMQDAQAGMRNKDLAVKYGVSKSMVSKLVGQKNRVPFDVARRIIASVDNGATIVDMAALYQIDYATARNIVRRRTKVAKRASESIYGG